MRSRSTTIIGERFYIYAAKANAKTPIWSDDLRVATPTSPLWMIERAARVKLIEPGASLPTGTIVGSAVIERVSRNEDIFEWYLKDVKRLSRHRKPTGRPQPVWFKPFDKIREGRSDLICVCPWLLGRKE